MKIKNEVSVQKITEDAENNYRGGYFCCEALMAAIRDNFELDVPDAVIAMSSGMAVGVGRSGCICGALNGGILALGLFFGRTEQNGPKDPKVAKCMELTNQLHGWCDISDFWQAQVNRYVYERQVGIFHLLFRFRNLCYGQFGTLVLMLAHTYQIANYIINRRL